MKGYATEVNLPKHQKPTAPKYGLLGKTLSHSYSPEIHAMLGNRDYRLLPMPEEQLGSFLQKGDFKGLNVTIPYKEAVIPYLSRLTARAKRLGAVNTISVDRDGALVGDNTDYEGFSYMLTRGDMHVNGKKCLVLGSGGASKTVCAVLEDRGASDVIVISRTGENNYENLEKHADAAFVVNTTPVGMYPENGRAPLDLTCFPKLEGVADLIYNPSRTALMQQAESLGIKTVGGLSMLVAQARAAHERFFRVKVHPSNVERITRRLRKRMRNLTLVGMPGCGKTTIAKRLAHMTGRTFADTDAIIEQMSGKKPSDIIREDGVALLREWETKALKSVAYQSGMVIATGGGIVTVPENLPILRENSTVVFLNRPNNTLSAFNRPLSSTLEAIQVLSEERLPLYRKVCDIEIKDDRSAKIYFSVTPKKLRRMLR